MLRWPLGFSDHTQASFLNVVFCFCWFLFVDCRWVWYEVDIHGCLFPSIPFISLRFYPVLLIILPVLFFLFSTFTFLFRFSISLFIYHMLNFSWVLWVTCLLMMWFSHVLSIHLSFSITLYLPLVTLHLGNYIFVFMLLFYILNLFFFFVLYCAFIFCSSLYLLYYSYLFLQIWSFHLQLIPTSPGNELYLLL